VSTQQDRKLRELVNGLQGPETSPLPTLRPEEPRGGIPAARGYVEKQYQPGSGGSGSAGIASPITEPDFSAREYYSTGLRSSDGLFFLPAVKKIVMQDANGVPAVFEFADPGNDL